MFAAGIVFAISLLLTIALFALKQWELSRARTVAPALRERADLRALQVKDLALAARKDLSKLPPHIVLIARLLIHEVALGIAALARLLERQAHRLADYVSHKRGFEKRETRSEFLKKVAERKNGDLDTTGGNGHNS